ncbi:hypothetical protein AGI3411_01285 [Achromobacter agilis]|uniref:Porin domain-containing protein n=1 Tax=Achromobacter agilis TaxID=1353888 RepID=A0A446C7B6_9BURK|nr:porin [Achromobacter agilis]SSW63683.1 hypothetical protein AGI3411_01285 [Achromobacter agilis]
MKIVFLGALAAAGMALPPAAAADGTPGVQLYGVVDAGMAVTNTSGQGSHAGLLNGGLTDSLWGLTGTEDMGGRLALPLPAGKRLRSVFGQSGGRRPPVQLRGLGRPWP